MNEIGIPILFGLGPTKRMLYGDDDDGLRLSSFALLITNMCGQYTKLAKTEIDCFSIEPIKWSVLNECFIALKAC